MALWPKDLKLPDVYEEQLKESFRASTLYGQAILPQPHPQTATEYQHQLMQAEELEARLRMKQADMRARERQMQTFTESQPEVRPGRMGTISPPSGHREGDHINFLPTRSTPVLRPGDAIANAPITQITLHTPFSVDHVKMMAPDMLKDWHEILHRYDWLEFQKDSVQVDQHRELATLSTSVRVAYRDPYLGDHFIVQQIPEEQLEASPQLAGHIMTGMLERIQTARSEKLATLMAFTDLRMEKLA